MGDDGEGGGGERGRVGGGGWEGMVEQGEK